MKLLLLSDQHLALFKNEKFESQKKNFFETIIQFFASLFGNRDRRLMEKMADVVLDEDIDVAIFNGDFAEASRTERGMNTNRDLEIISQLRDVTLKTLGILVACFNLGNHESGYDLPLCTDLEKGINLTALKNFFTFAGWKNLYHSFILENCRCIFVPYVFSEHHAKDFDLQAMKDEYLQSMSRELLESIPTVLFVHDPDSFADEKLLNLIRQHRESIKFIFFGHYHSWINLISLRILSTIYGNDSFRLLQSILNLVFLGLAKGDREIVRKLGEYFRERRDIPGIIKELGAILIPAPSGTFGIGGGYFYTLDIEKMELKKHK